MKKLFLTIALVAGLASSSFGATSAQTKFLYHCNGEDAATSGTSDDAGARTITFGGGAALTTTYKVFGTAGLYLPYASSSYLSIPADEVWNLGSNDFTFDCRAYWISLPSYALHQTFVSQYVNSKYYWRLFIIGDVGGATFLGLLEKSGGSFVINVSSTSTGLTSGGWHHIAFVRATDTLYYFVDGNLISYSTVSTSIGVTPYTSTLCLGSLNNGGDSNFKGYMDEIRLVIGSAEWTTAFTPPTEEYSFAEAASTSDFFSLF
jgi:hypothetical protein